MKHLRRAALLLMLVLTLIVPAGSAGAADAAWPFPGLYYPADTFASWGSTQARLVSPLKCSVFLQALAAGQWSVSTKLTSVVLDLNSGTTVPGPLWATFTQGNSMVYVVASDTAGGCDARLSKAYRKTVTANGTVSAKGPAFDIPMQCLAPGDAADSGLVQLAIQGPKTFRGFIQFDIPAKKGTYDILATDPDLTVIVGASSSSILSLYENAIKQSAATGEDAFSGMSELSPGDGATASLKLTRVSSTVEGTLTVTNFIDSSGASQNLTLAFECAAA